MNPQNQLRAILEGDYKQSPGFKFALDTGRKAIERSAAAKGMGNSGNVMYDLTKFATGLAMQDYGADIDRRLGAQRSWWDYDLGSQRNANDAASAQNRFNLDWLNAGTNRASAMSRDYWSDPYNLRKSFGGKA